MKKLYAFEVQRKARQFLNCQRLEDLNRIGLDANQVIFNAMHPRYYTFDMPKKSGGFRTIEAPNVELKALQRKFNFYLQCIYYTQQSPAAYGYVIRVRDRPHSKNILGNAKAHLGAQYMLNVDFEGFFHQISEQNIFQLLQTTPFQFDKKTAHALVKIFTYKKRLPMGAPTSPALSNIVALPLDQALSDWANTAEMTYTRFVDDLTFSSKSKPINQDHYEAIKTICIAHQLQLNPTKTKFFGVEDTKQVTGLLLNYTVDIDPRFYRHLDRDLKRLQRVAEVSLIVNKHIQDATLKSFKQEIDGQINFIGMIEGYNSKEFVKYRKKLTRALNPSEQSLSARWTNFNYF